MKLENMIHIIQHLNHHLWVPKKELALNLNIHERTLLRHIEEIRQAFSPYEIIESSRKGYKLADHNDFFEIMKRQEDYENMAAVLSTPLRSVIHTKKEYPSVFMERINNIIDVRQAAPGDILQVLFIAMKENRYLKMEYKSHQEVKEHHCVPLKLYLDNAMLYLNVYDDDYGHMITMSLSRIQSVTLAPSGISTEEASNLRKYLNSAWGKMLRHDQKAITQVTFEVDDITLVFFEKLPMHSSQTITHPHGTHVVTLNIHHPTEFTRYCLRFGPGVRIISPEEVLLEMKNYLHEMQTFYEA